MGRNYIFLDDNERVKSWKDGRKKRLAVFHRNVASFYRRITVAGSRRVGWLFVVVLIICSLFRSRGGKYFLSERDGERYSVL